MYHSQSQGVTHNHRHVISPAQFYKKNKSIYIAIKRLQVYF